MAIQKPKIRSAVDAEMENRPIAGGRKKRQRMQIIKVGLPERDLEVFRAHMEDQGLNLSAGVRLAVSQYMQKEGLK